MALAYATINDIMPADALEDADVLEVLTAAGSRRATFTLVRAVVLSKLGQAGGPASLDTDGQVPDAQLATGEATGATFLRGDRQWAAPPTPTVLAREVSTSGAGAPVTTFEFPDGTLTVTGAKAKYTPPPAPTGGLSTGSELVFEPTTPGTNGFDLGLGAGATVDNVDLVFVGVGYVPRARREVSGGKLYILNDALARAIDVPAVPVVVRLKGA